MSKEKWCIFLLTACCEGFETVAGTAAMTAWWQWRDCCAATLLTAFEEYRKIKVGVPGGKTFSGTCDIFGCRSLHLQLTL